MKKRSILLSILLVVSMFITACGAADPFEGKWSGNCDLTDYIMDELLVEYEEYAEYFEFDDLTIGFDFEFEEGNVTMSVNEESMDTFIANLEDGVYNMMDKMIVNEMIVMYQGMLPDENIQTLDDVAALTDGMYANGQAILDDVASESGYATYEEFLTAAIEEIDAEGMMDSLIEDFDISGTYEYDEEEGVLTFYYEDDTYEEMQYKFTDDTLMIRLSDGEAEFDVECEKVTE